MKKSLGIATVCTLVATLAHAQSSVTLFGLVDAGVSFVNNEGGKHNTFFDSGIWIPNLLGFTGAEDLGGGTTAIFKLVNQFDLGSGKTLPSGDELFGRTAYVGLKNDRLGTLTFGNHYDFMNEELLAFDQSDYTGGFYNFRQGPFTALGIPNNPTGSWDFDRVAGTARVANSVRYMSPEWSGLSMGALYGFSNLAGAFSTGNTMSFSANYNRGAFSLGAAYTDVKYLQINNGHDGIRNWGLGARYNSGSVLANVLYTNTKNTFTGGAVNMIQVGANWHFTPAWAIGGAYEYMKGNAQLTNNRANQFEAMLSYALSKRTTVGLEAMYQRAGGDEAQTSAWMNGLSPSSTNSQMLTRIGMTTSF